MAVTRADKVTAVAEIEGVFKSADAAILLDFTGLDVPRVTELRRELRKAGAGYKVVKNTLARRALTGTSFETLVSHFEGVTAVAYTSDDAVALAKTLTTFMKGAPTLQVKAGLVQGQAIQAADVADLASLPGRPELYAQLLYVLQGPATNLVRVLNAAPRDLMSVLAQAEQQRGGDAG